MFRDEVSSYTSYPHNSVIVIKIKSAIVITIVIIVIRFNNNFNSFELGVAGLGLLATKLRSFSFALSSDIESGILMTTTLGCRPDPLSVLG